MQDANDKDDQWHNTRIASTMRRTELNCNKVCRKQTTSIQIFEKCFQNATYLWSTLEISLNYYLSQNQQEQFLYLQWRLYCIFCNSLARNVFLIRLVLSAECKMPPSDVLYVQVDEEQIQQVRKKKNTIFSVLNMDWAFYYLIFNLFLLQLFILYFCLNNPA